jgi:hypothetical protein
VALPAAFASLRGPPSKHIGQTWVSRALRLDLRLGAEDAQTTPCVCKRAFVLLTWAWDLHRGLH